MTDLTTITFKFTTTKDLHGDYWIPISSTGEYSVWAAGLIHYELGFVPETFDWEMKPRKDGWHSFDVMGRIAFELTKIGYDVRFIRQS